MVEVMIFLANNADNKTRSSYTPDTFVLSPSDIAINCLLFASLSASIVAALASVVALQWVAEYDAAITRAGSSPEDRAKRRQFRHEGVLWWKMGEIISALPILLYFSVIIFFLGLILWMYAINHVVGLVVIIGATVALLFYGISTFLGVAFASTPFRTPLIKWIYSLSRLPFSVGYRLSKNVINVFAIPPWLETQHRLYNTSSKRDDRAIQNRSGLSRDALDWLATQLSISRNSYSRLLILVDELLHLNPDQLPSFELRDKSWSSIFDYLGWMYLSNMSEGPPTAEERQFMTLLQRLYALPGVRELISPRPKVKYVSNINEEAYWAQHCDYRQTGTWRIDHDVPNRLFLLLRDTPPPCNFSDSEVDASIRVTRWRNSMAKRPQDLDTVFAQGSLLHAKYLNALVVTFSHYICYSGCFRSSSTLTYSDLRMYLGIITKLMHMAEASRNVLLPHAVVPLIQSFETGLLLQSGGELSTLCLARPLLYGRKLSGDAPELKEAHSCIPVILSRLLTSYSAAELVFKVRDVLAMLWIHSNDLKERTLSNIEERTKDNLKERTWDELPFMYGGSEIEWVACRALSVDWIKATDLTPHIREIMNQLASIQGDHSSIGPLWRTTWSHKGNDPNFVEALQTLDRLIGEGRTSDDHYTFVKLVCQDLELEPGPEFDGYFAEERLNSIALLNDPCLQLLARCAIGVDENAADLVMRECRGQMVGSWGRIAEHLMRKYPRSYSAPILQLQASLWLRLPSRLTFYRDAAQDSEVLSHLQRIFGFPVNCDSCHDGSYHLLQHLLNSGKYFFARDLALFGRIKWLRARLPPKLLALCRPFADKPPSIRDLNECSDACMGAMSTMFDAIESSQWHLLVFLRNVTREYETGHQPWVEELAVVVACINRALELPRKDEATMFLYPLAKSISCVKLRVCEGFTYTTAAQPLVLKETVITTYLLLGELATGMVFGNSNSRIVACVQSKRGVRVSVGQLQPYE